MFLIQHIWKPCIFGFIFGTICRCGIAWLSFYSISSANLILSDMNTNDCMVACNIHNIAQTTSHIVHVNTGTVPPDTVNVQCYTNDNEYSAPTCYVLSRVPFVINVNTVSSACFLLHNRSQEMTEKKSVAMAL